MKIETIKTLYFSPTGTTRKIVEAIARGASPSTMQSIDLTLLDSRVRGSDGLGDFLRDYQQ